MIQENQISLTRWEEISLSSPVPRPPLIAENVFSAKGVGQRSGAEFSAAAGTLAVETERSVFRPTPGQARKSARGMPWHQEPTKDVTSCDKPRGGANIR